MLNKKNNRNNHNIKSYISDSNKIYVTDFHSTVMILSMRI